ncbi:hypothetical protein [Legionella cardiaca]|uniref:Dot/Icm T4SS effector n=1 Tax=Legionella cardiaca TaxID=1071983 RepID=A0ABY8APP6_9GAMM|nr:hypothetical protein [Legionella cardiaca]WED42680.1 hypothetical protein PXX05_12350 [Legionella cardiaca]
MAIRYLIDVDDTLMVTHGEKGTVFNEKLIDELKRLGVDRIDLLTKMDSIECSPGKALRVSLIKHLEENGIQVGNVLTTLENMFLNSGYFSGLKLGDVYPVLMKPVEVAVNSLAQIKNYSKRYAQYLEHKNNEKKIRILDFLIKNQVLLPKDSIEDVRNKRDTCTHSINQLLINHSTIKGQDPAFNDIQYLFNEFRDYCKHHPESANLMTINDFYEKLVKACSNYQAPEDNTVAEQQLIDNYLLEFAHYGNLRYIASLLCQRNSSSTNEHDSKGNIYVQYVGKDVYQTGDTVLFIDDSNREQDSVRKAHASLGNFELSLDTISPPIQGDITEFNCQGAHIPLEQFRKQHSKHYMQLLCREGDLALKSHKSYFAVDCYKTAYLLIDDLGQDTPFSKEELLQKIMEAYKTNDPNLVGYTEKEDEVLKCMYASLNGKTDMQLRILEREQELHALRNPTLYKREGMNPFRFMDKKPETIDSDFNNKVLGSINVIISKDPGAREACSDFLSSLSKRLRYERYQGAVETFQKTMLSGPQFR